MKGYGFYLLKYMKGYGNLSFPSVYKNARKGSQMHFIMAVKKSRKRSQSGFLFIHILKKTHLQQLKEMQTSKLDM